jgi:pseudouridine synthase
MTAQDDPRLDAPTGVRLARFMAACGVASRRACEELIRAGLVRVNDTPVLTPACTVVPGRDHIEYRGATLEQQPAIWLLLNKPTGYTCSAHDEHAAKLIFELIPAHFGRLFSVGRLDRDSEGLIVLTNDGDLAQALAHPSRRVPKTYYVEARGRLGAAGLARLRQGITDAGEFLRPLTVTPQADAAGLTCLRLVLEDGRKREVRRLCAAVGLTVVRLRRERLGPLCLGSLPAGQFRRLEPAELTALRQAGATAARAPEP